MFRRFSKLATFVFLSLGPCACGGADDAGPAGGSGGAASGGNAATGASPSGGSAGANTGGVTNTGGGAGANIGGAAGSGGSAGANTGGAAGVGGAATGGAGSGGAPSYTTIDLLANQKYPARVAVDANNVYWSSAELPTDSTLGGLWRLPKQGGTPELLHSGNGMVDFTLDGSSLYTMQGAFFADVISVSISTKAVKVLANQVGASRVATDSTHLYWIGTNSKDLMRVPKAGGTSQVLTTTLSQPRALAVDASYVYVSNDFGGALLRFPKTGGAATPLFTAPSGSGEIDLIEVGPSALYWETSGSYTKPGVVYELANGQSQPKTLAGTNDVLWFALDAANLYVATNVSQNAAAVSARPLSGAAWNNVALLENKPSTFVVDATHVYFTSYKAGVVARVPK